MGRGSSNTETPPQPPPPPYEFIRKVGEVAAAETQNTPTIFQKTTDVSFARDVIDWLGCLLPDAHHRANGCEVPPPPLSLAGIRRTVGPGGFAPLMSIIRDGRIATRALSTFLPIAGWRSMDGIAISLFPFNGMRITVSPLLGKGGFHRLRP